MAIGSYGSKDVVSQLPIARLYSLRAILAEWLLPAPKAGSPCGMKRRILPIILGLGYIAVIGLLGGLRSDHVFVGMLALLDYYNQKTRLFLRYFLPFILTGIVFDSMRYYYWPGVRGHVHVDGPYFRDLRWFGIPVHVGSGTRIVTPNEYFQIYHLTALDLLSGFAYLFFVAEYLFTAFYLFIKNYLHAVWVFGWCFFTVNVMGYITYFIYPAAPPWYVSEYGLGPAQMTVHPEMAAARRFDNLLGTHVFSQMYGRGIDVFGAYPSLHVSYPLLVVWMTFLFTEFRWFRIPAILFYFLMCFSAVYLQHHYVVDIILGSIYALTVAAVASLIVEKKRWRQA